MPVCLCAVERIGEEAWDEARVVAMWGLETVLKVLIIMEDF